MVAPQDREEEVVVRLARIGFDRVAGYLREPEGAFLDAPEHIARASRLTAPELATALHGPQPPFVVDVRNPGELRPARSRGRPMPLAQLPGRLAEIPRDRPVVAYCAGGYRSSVAASCCAAQASTTCPTCWAATAPGCRSPSPSAERARGVKEKT